MPGRGIDGLVCQVAQDRKESLLCGHPRWPMLGGEGNNFSGKKWLFDKGDRERARMLS